MLEFFKNLLTGEPFIPHGHCYLWKPDLVGLHIVSDFLIAVAYYSIPITLLYFVRKRQDLPYSWIFLLFSAFIVACGTTHLMEVWTLWYPTYWLSGCIKAITAFVSVVTAIELVPLIPKALALPSPAQLEAANRELEREIGERKIAQAALQEREQFLSNIYNSVTDTLWVVEQLEDGEFQVVSMNRAIETSTGIVAEYWIGKRLDELWDSQTVATIRAHYHDCLQQGQTISYEENLPLGEQTRCFLTTLTPLLDSHGRTRLLGVSMDITERKRAEEELRWKETLLRSMTDASPLAFYVVDNRTDNILYFNHRFCTIWGIEHLEAQMQSRQLKNNDIIPDCLPLLADVPAFAESCQPLQSEANRAVVEDEIPFSDGRTLRRFSTQIRDEGDRYFGRLYLFEDVTERKQIEEKLQLADFSLEHSSLATAWIDRDARILRVNQAACEQVGYSREELLSMRVWDINQNFPMEVWPQHWQELKAQKTLSFTSQEYRKDGSVIPVEITLNYLEFNGKEYNFACSRDISDRCRAEDALQASQTRLSGILDIADEAIISVNSSQHITLYNQGAERIFGYSSEEMLGQTLDRLLPERLTASHHQHIKKFAQSTQTARKMGKRGEILGRRKDGTEFPAEASISQLELAGEKVFTVFLRDISDRKQAEAALQESEARFQAFMNASPTAAWMTDKNGLLLYFNQTYSRMFNLSNDLVGKIDLTSIHPPEFSQEYLKNIRKVLETNQTLEAIELGLLSDGSIGEYLVYKFPLPRSSGKVLVGGIAIDITALKKAEAALQKREQEFRALVENAPDIIMRLDRECRYLYINPTVERHSGIPPAEFVGKTIEEFGASEALIHCWRTAIKQVFETGCEQNIEYEIPSVAGITYYASRIVPEFDGDGSVQSILAIARDISERKVAEMALETAKDELEIRVRKRTAELATANQVLTTEISERQQAQAALQASEARLKAVLDNTAAFIYSARIYPDKPWEYEYYSPKVEEIFGYKGEEFAADPSLWFSRIPPEDRETIVQPAMENLYAGQQITIEYRFLHQNGDLRWLSNTLLAKKHQTADYWFVTGIVIDITQQKQAEKALQESEQRFAALARTAPVGIYRNDTQGYCIYGNKRCLEMLGISLEELIGEGWITRIYPEDRDRIVTAWYSFVQQGIPYDYEIRLQRPDGSMIWVLAQAIAEKDAEGNIMGYIGTITDITERKQAEQLLKDYNQILETQVQERTAELTRINAQLEQEITERKQIEAQLRRSEAKLSVILNNAGAFIYIKDLNSNYTYINRLTAEFFGLTEPEIIGASDFRFFSEELALSVRANDAQVIQSGVVHRFEEVGFDRHGEVHYFLSTKVPLKSLDGSIYGICGISTDITELKRTEAALRQSEERIQALLSAIPDLMFRHRIDGTYLDVAGNDNALLVPREMLIGKKLQNTPIPESVKADLLERFQIVAATGTLQIYEHDLEKPDGIHSYETRIVKSGADEVVCLVRDITERKRSQAALQESEERYRTVITAMAEGIVLQNADGTIRTCNASARHILGLSRKQMMGRTSFDPTWRAVREDGSPFPGEEHPAMVTLRTGKACSNVVMGVHKPDGNFTWISINSQPLFRTGEPLPYAVVASFADITARKQAEEALRQSEARLKHLTASIPGTLYSYGYYPDGSTRFEYVSLGCQDMFEVEPEQVLEDQNVLLNQISPDDRSKHEEAVARAVQNVEFFTSEWRNIAPSGKQRWLRVQAQPECREDGSKVWHGVILDISDRKQAEATLQKALQVAQAASIAKSRFLSNMSHELRTPLNAILGFSQVLVRSPSLSPEQKEQLKIINRSGEHLLNLINDILSMAKIEAGQVTLKNSRFDLYQLLEDLEQMLKFKATSKGLELIFERAYDLPHYIQTDENKLRQVLINLLGNAIKFTASGHVILRVKRGRLPGKFYVREPKSEGNLLFEIEDTGPGIASHEIGTLFDPFVQTEAGLKSMQGTGLGLPISRQFVQMMSGNIAVSSQLGKGSIFTFDILALEVAEADKKYLLTTGRAIGLEPNQPIYRILVVEDVEENRQLLFQLLEPLGFQVRGAANGREAIMLWLTWKPHLIWMDMRMPVMDGYEATRAIRTLEQQCVEEGENHNSSQTESSPTSRTKIIALTASAFEEQQTKILTAGCDDLVHKPFQASLLFDKMAQHLGVRYIYEEKPEDSEVPQAAPRKLVPDDLSVMPLEWIAQLHQATLCADDRLIVQLLEQLPDTEVSLARALKDLVDNFRLDLLLDLTQQFNHES